MRLLPLATAVVLAVPLAATPAEAAAAPAEVRVDQVGYALGEAKHAYLLGGAPGEVHRRRRARPDRPGGPNRRESRRLERRSTPKVFDLDLSTVDRPGTYRRQGRGSATSPPFRIDTADAVPPARPRHDRVLPGPARRPHVIPGRLDRKPSHLADRAGDRLRRAEVRRRRRRRNRRTAEAAGRPGRRRRWLGRRGRLRQVHLQHRVLAGRAGFRAARRPRPRCWRRRSGSASTGSTRCGTPDARPSTRRSASAPAARSSASSATTTSGAARRTTTR